MSDDEKKGPWLTRVARWLNSMKADLHEAELERERLERERDDAEAAARLEAYVKRFPTAGWFPKDGPP